MTQIIHYAIAFVLCVTTYQCFLRNYLFIDEEMNYRKKTIKSEINKEKKTIPTKKWIIYYLLTLLSLIVSGWIINFLM